MKPPVETVRVSVRGREILIKLKRRTGLDQWNELCRWALCTSLSLPSRPVAPTHQQDSTIQIDWKTFAGGFENVLTAAVLMRASGEGIASNSADLAKYFRSHLERGIGLIQNVKSLPSLLTGTMLKEESV